MMAKGNKILNKKIIGRLLHFNNNIATIEFENNLDDTSYINSFYMEKPTKHRGKDANALSWTLIDRIAKHLNQSRDEIYDIMLQRYGVATYLVVKPNYANRILETFGHGRILGDVTIDGKKGTQLQIFLGSSTYNSEEFTHYLQGIISECEAMNLVIENKDVFIQALAEWDT